ncbi:hypothetical protein LSTR_LSTR017507 [Laodelphax striatellus]|uniref:Uncharacterized protein n=1 Tax=Laodelphax striatellus TaxID=195883 RepID=A0A482WXE8_LAOST|nr:hypothetical protein LSTR_LSTR017507 [Laodelphax striatellus]
MNFQHPYPKLQSRLHLQLKRNVMKSLKNQNQIEGKKQINVMEHPKNQNLMKVKKQINVIEQSDESKAVEKCDKIAEISEPVPILKCDGKGSPAKKCTFSDRPPLVHALSESYNDGAEKDAYYIEA